jgi:hypothetical protein
VNGWGGRRNERWGELEDALRQVKRSRESQDEDVW